MKQKEQKRKNKRENTKERGFLSVSWLRDYKE